MSISRSNIAAVALAGSLFVSACGGNSSSHAASAHTSRTSSSSTTSSTSATSSSSEAMPSVTTAASQLQEKLRSDRTLEMQSSGNASLLGPMATKGTATIDIKGSPGGDPSEMTIATSEFTTQVLRVNGTTYLKGNAGYWQMIAKQNGANPSDPRLKRYTDHWLKVSPSNPGVAILSKLTIRSLLGPIYTSNLTGSDGLNDSNTDISPATVQGQPAWQLSDKTGDGTVWMSQKTHDLLTVKLSKDSSGSSDLTELRFSNANKEFHLSAPTDAITPTQSNRPLGEI